MFFLSVSLVLYTYIRIYSYLEVAISFKLALNLQSFSLSLPNVGIIGVCHSAQHNIEILF
jgi:hypothetical protein